MEALNYSELLHEIEEKLRKEDTIVLATSAKDKVTARLMCHINYGATVLFGTSRKSQKVDQIEHNPNIALAIGNLKMEAVAELYGHPKSHPTFRTDYIRKFPHLEKVYKSSPDDVLVIARPRKIALFKYIDGPCEDVLLPEEERAYRIKLV